MLFVAFLLSGIILFLLIYAYSVVQIKKQNNKLSTVAEIAEESNKTSLFDKFKRRKSPKIDPEAIEDSSVSVGGVTAKVSDSIKQVVALKTEKIPSRKDRVAPQLTAETIEFSKSGQIDEEKAPKLDVKSEIKQVEEKVDIESNESIGLIDKQKIKPSESVSSDVVLEQMAEEYAAQQSEADRVSPDAIEQVYAEQQINAAESVNQVAEKAIESSESSIPYGAQQDLLDQAGVETEQTEIKESDAAKSLTNDKMSPVGEPDLQEAVVQQERPSSPVKREFRAGANAVEIVAKISGGKMLVRDDALIIFRKYDYLFTRHLGIYGKNTLTELWEDVEQAGQEDSFSEVALSLQLADKTGAMTRKESNTFSTLAIELSDSADKKLEFSLDIDDSVEKGRMLDELARKYDAMVVCNIIPKRRKGFRSTDIKSCTKDLEMMPSKNGVFGRYAKVSETSRLRYSLALANSDGEYIPSSTRDPFQVDEIVVFMNVPLVVNPVDAFQTMINDARKLGAWMDGKIVDKNARNMTSRTLDKIADQILMIEKEMSRDGLIPGSEICKKLF